MTLKDHVIRNIESKKFYQSRFPSWMGTGNVQCCFHDDKNPSLAINLVNGGAKCHSASCGIAIGNIVHFEAARLHIKESLAALHLYSEFVRKLISPSHIEAFHKQLTENQKMVIRLRDEAGLTLKTAKTFHLGYDQQTKRIIIPIEDQWGNYINLRRYKLPSMRRPEDEDRKVLNLKGFGALDIFPWQCLNEFTLNDPVYLMASEKETMLATQMGMQAICTTTGEGSWNPDWNYLLAGYNLFIVFDTDKGGIAAAAKMQTKLVGYAESCKIIRLPVAPPTGKDFADWILKGKGNRDGLRLLQKFKSKSKSPSLSEHDGERETPKLPPLIDRNLYDLADISSKPEILNHRIMTEGILAAKSTESYSIPWQFRVKIPNRTEYLYSMSIGRELLRFVKAHDEHIQETLRELVGSHTASIVPVHYVSVTEVEVIPTAVIDRDVPYTTQRCFYFGDRIEANVPYFLEIIPTTEIRTQATVGIIVKKEPKSKSIEQFDFNAENLQQLQVFIPSSTEQVWGKLEAVGSELATRFTKIYNRLDWHLVALLSWTSPIGWRFPGEDRMQRGWLNSLAIGDTETGKSRIVETYRSLFNCGTIISSENCTLVGLIGGAIKSATGQFMLRWGRIPLGDKQLVVIEEFAGMTVQEISNMSDVRSSGIARLDKGGLSAETNARTRLIILSNVRPVNKTLADYVRGVHAVQELIGHAEDIARFDLIITLVDNEVSTEVINSPMTNSRFSGSFVAESFEPENLQLLIHFIWALQPEQIQFTMEAYLTCLEETKRLSTIYHPSIPIFKGGSGRYKIGRIAASIACLQFAWNGAKIVVERKHVRAASKFLRMLYDKPSLGYATFSKELFDRDSLKNEGELLRLLQSRIPRKRLGQVLEVLIHSTKFSRDELCAVAGIPNLYADQIIGTMLRCRALKKGTANVWDITPAGAVWMSRQIK